MNIQIVISGIQEYYDFFGEAHQQIMFFWGAQEWIKDKGASRGEWAKHNILVTYLFFI